MTFLFFHVKWFCSRISQNWGFLRMLHRFIGTRSFYKSVLTLLIPIVIQQFISSFVSLLDNIMVGSLGTEAISAASIANSVLMVHMLAIFGGLSGASIFGAQFFGKGDMEGMRFTFRFKLYFGVICSAAAILIYLLFYSWIHGGFGGPKAVLVQFLAQGDYLYSYLLLIPILAFYSGKLGYRNTFLHRCYQCFYPAHLAALFLLGQML